VSAIFIVLSALALFLALHVFLKLRKMEKSRTKELRESDQFESAPYTSELPLDPRKTINKSVKSISERFSLIRRFVLPLVIFFGILVGAIPFLDGVARSYVSIIVGAITVIVGFAARPFIENLISGLILSMGKSIKTGDTILIDNHYGTVEEIKLTYAVIKIWDWRRYIVPNSEFIQKAFINYTYLDEFVWTKVELSVALDEDIDRVKELCVAAMKKSSALADYGEPEFWVMGLKGDRVDCWLAGWANTPPEAWSLAHETRTEIARIFLKEKIKGHLENISLKQDNQTAA
jgi:small-conductance mechanosensitive channel